MRYFISIDLNDELQKYIKRIQDEVYKLYHDISRIPSNQGHVTLNYIGELDETTINVLRVRLRELMQTQKQFKINTTQIGTFPSKKDASVIWLGVYPSKDVVDIQKNIRELTNKLMINKTKTYEFIPHITIVRVNTTHNERELQNVFKRVVNIKEITMNVNEIKLKQSIITPQGPKYYDIETFTLHV